MNIPSVLLLPGAIALSLMVVPGVPALASPVAPVAPTIAPPPGADIKLNDTQKAVIQKVGTFAFDQIEAVLSQGLNPDRKAPLDTAKKAQELGETMKSLRLDEQQKSGIRDIVRYARQQMEKQMETALPTKK